LATGLAAGGVMSGDLLPGGNSGGFEPYHLSA
jgi:hypothetical protein